MTDKELAERIYIKLIETRMEPMTREFMLEAKERAWMAVKVFTNDSEGK